MNRRPVLAIAAWALFFIALFAVAGLLSGCSNQTVRDLEGVPVAPPEKVTITANVDKYPDIVAICVHGLGFATTTRPDHGAIFRVPEWDASGEGWCGK